MLDGPSDGAFRNAEGSSSRTEAGAVGEELTQFPGVGDHAWTSEPFPLRPCSPQPGMRALDDPGPFYFSEHADEGEHRSAHRAGEIEGFSKADESDTDMLELVEQRYEVTEVAPSRSTSCSHCGSVTIGDRISAARRK